MRRHFLRLAVAAALVPATAGIASAQLNRTGGSVVSCAFAGGCDANWAVQWFGLPGGVASGVTGTLANAAIVTTIPSPPWAPNIPGTQQWIGITSNAVAPTASTGNNAANYRYFFTTTVANVPSAFTLGLGWDNRLAGVFAGALAINADGSYSGGTSVFDVSPYANKSAFCRDGDGVFPTSGYPGTCLVDGQLSNVPGGSTTLTFVLEGDGQTDGLLVSGVSATPEPASLALMGTGLLGLGIVGARRRRRAA